MFKLSIRELLLLTVVAALACAWWLTWRELAKERSFRLGLVQAERPYGWLQAEQVWIKPKDRPKVEY
jgi:hypothetical protein